MITKEYPWGSYVLYKLGYSLSLRKLYRTPMQHTVKLKFYSLNLTYNDI